MSILRTALLISLVFSSYTNLTAQTSSITPDFAAIDAYIEAQMKNLRVPGLAIGIVHGDQIVHVRGFGIADPSGRPVTPQTPFTIGSLSKSFTALAIMQLVEAGKINLDAPVQRYLPWFRVADEEASARITLRQLLNHTSGLSTRTSQEHTTDEDVSDDALEQRVRSFRTASLTHPTGTTFEYSGANYAILGMVLQIVSRQPYETYIQEHIFAPLNMRQSFASQTAAQQHGMASGYLYWFGFPVATDLPFNRGSIAQGYLISSAEDMTHFLIAQLNHGRFNSASLLSPQGIAETHRPTIQTGDADTSYGMGWEVGPIGGVPAIWHEGSVYNFHSNMALMPDGQWGVIILENIYSGPDQARLNQITEGVICLLAGRQPPAPATNYLLLIVYVLLFGIIALQIIWIVRSGKRLRLWRKRLDLRPRGWWRIIWYVLLPFIIGMTWAVFVLVFVPLPLGISWLALVARIPDLGYMLLISGSVALGWAVIKVVLACLTVFGRTASSKAA